MLSIVWIFASYFIGSIPFGVLFAQGICGIDPRTAGSGNVGATNVARLCGKKWGAATLLGDVFKGAFPVFVATLLSQSALVLSLTALAAIFGHLFSCFLGFRGGKAVATTVGIFIPLAFWQLVVSGIVCLFLIWRSGFVSLGSLALVTTMPVVLLVSGRFSLLPLAFVVLGLVFWTHRENIRRLSRGEEKSWIKKNG